MRIAFAMTAALSAFLLVGCATPYQSMGLTGGVAARQISSDTAQITARGNAYTDPDTIQQYALRKASETTINAGFDTFEILTDADRSLHGAAGSAYGNNGYAFGSSWQMIKPGETFMIKMRKGPLPSDAPANMFDAHDVLAHLTASTTHDSKKCAQVDGKVKCD